MKLVPVPTDDHYIQVTAPHWFPFLEGISRRSKEPVQSLFNYIVNRQVQVLLAWDEQAQKAVAIAGVRFWLRGPDLIGDLVWCTGRNRKEWQHLLAEIEHYLKDVGCAECRPTARLGWSKLLKQHGYKATHVVMEKVLL